MLQPDADLPCYAIDQLARIDEPEPVHRIALARRLREVYRYAEAREAALGCLDTALRTRAIEELALGCAHRGLWHHAAHWYALSPAHRFEHIYTLLQVGRWEQAEALVDDPGAGSQASALRAGGDNLVNGSSTGRAYWRGRIMLFHERWADALAFLVEGDADEDELTDVRWAVEPKPLGEDEDPPGPCSSLVLGQLLVRDKTSVLRGRILQAQGLADLGRPREAWACYYRHVGMLGRRATAYRLTTAADLHARMGHFSKAACLFERAEPEEGRGDGLVTAAGHWLRCGNPEAAERCCRLALELDPAIFRDEALATLGSALRSQKRYAEAARCFVDALGIDPDKDDALRTAIQDMQLCSGSPSKDAQKTADSDSVGGS